MQYDAVSRLSVADEGLDSKCQSQLYVELQL